MPAIYRPQSGQIADPDTGNISQTWATALSRLMDAISGPIQIRSFTVATMPNPAKYPNSLIYVSDASGGPTVACSDGTHWRIVAVLGANVT
jgi:hypothetical protein